MKRIITIIGIAFISQIAFAQDASIKVFDKETKQPIPYANVCFEGSITMYRIKFS